MSATALVLVLVSAVVHASWNMLGKRSRPSTAFFGVASLTGAALIAPFALVWRDTVAMIPSTVWLLLPAAGVFQMLYFTGLAGAYRTGEMSASYPIARALPVLLVPLVTLLIGQGEPPRPAALAGMVVVAAGVLIVPQRSLRRFSWTHLKGRWFAYALLAGVGTTGYSIVDDAALRAFRAAVGPEAASVRAPLIYAMFEALAITVCLLASGLLLRGAGGTAREVRSVPVREALLSGVGIMAAYGLVLIALGFARNVSYVVAFRQVSLPIGAFLAAAILKERVNAARIAGTLVLVAGLVMVALA